MGTARRDSAPPIAEFICLGLICLRLTTEPKAEEKFGVNIVIVIKIRLSIIKSKI